MARLVRVVFLFSPQKDVRFVLAPPHPCSTDLGRGWPHNRPATLVRASADVWDETAKGSCAGGDAGRDRKFIQRAWARCLFRSFCGCRALGRGLATGPPWRKVLPNTAIRFRFTPLDSSSGIMAGVSATNSLTAGKTAGSRERPAASGRSSVWKSACFGSRRPQVRFLSPGPAPPRPIWPGNETVEWAIVDG